ncbi:MAG: hypothetical protein IKV05_06650 [Bacteroidales bacterium]|nr:hypothetical protein [Bacteroidales bacterium]
MNKKLVIFFLSALAIAGCAKEPQTGEPVDPDVQDANFSLLASSDVFTKTELCNCKDIVWKAGDCLSVWEKGSATNLNAQLTLDETTAGTQSGLFKGTLTPAADFELYAIYPYNAEYGNDHTALSLTIPTSVNQSADVNSIVGYTDFMLGKASSEHYDSESGAYKMLFKHPLAFVQFHIDGRGCIYEQATIKSLTMKADVAFVGAVNVNLEDGTVVSAAQGDEGKTLVINFPATAKMKDPQDAWVAINPVDLSNANCQFILEMTNGQKVTFKVNPNKMNGQALYKFEFKDIDAKIASGKGVMTPVRIDSYNGTYMPSNCYIVKEGGYYQFDSRSVDKVNVFAGSKPYTDGYRAKWLWSTGTESIVSNVGIGDSGRISFALKANANGNAVIALCDKDGKIVWSWHIWAITMENPMEPTHWSRGDTWLMSDINLGATSKAQDDENAYGLYYQWGRKDPFPADKTKCVFNTGVTIKGVSSKNADVTADAVGYAVANPTYFLYENTYRTWISNADQAVNAQSLWNNTTTKSAKTKYDPCPQGYCVPPQNSHAWYTYFTSANVKFVNSGITYSYDGVTTFYPAAGYLSGGTLTDAGMTVRCWAGNLTATPTANSNMAGYSLLCTLSASAIKNNEASRAAFALPIRCMKQ